VLSSRGLLCRARRQPALDRQLHRLFDRNPHDAGVSIDPPVRREHPLFRFAKSAEVAAWVGLQSRLRRQAWLVGGGPSIASPMPNAKTAERLTSLVS